MKTYWGSGRIAPQILNGNITESVEKYSGHKKAFLLVLQKHNRVAPWSEYVFEILSV